jgi:hypothetical protein
MKIEQGLISQLMEFQTIKTSDSFSAVDANLVFGFGEREIIENCKLYEKLRSIYAKAEIVICSTAGQFMDYNLINNTIVVTAIEFEKTPIKISRYNLLDEDRLFNLGERVQKEIVTDDLSAIIVLSEGTYVNGTELVQELSKATDSKVKIFGGIAGDSVNFQKTLVGVNENPKEGEIAIIGFYGNHMKFGFGCEGGWTDFGPEREVTHSEKNVLYKIGDHFALDLYKDYLGQYADDLPGSALYFPLSMKENPNASPIVRTILSINEEEKSMTFAGDIPQGALVKLMKGNFDKLIDAAFTAATATIDINESSKSAALVMAVSCVGRKIVLDNRIEEEIEIMKEVYGENAFLFGFYSYGEISPVVDHKSCELHNQTISIATMLEIE